MSDSISLNLLRKSVTGRMLSVCIRTSKYKNYSIITSAPARVRPTVMGSRAIRQERNPQILTQSMTFSTCAAPIPPTRNRRLSISTNHGFGISGQRSFRDPASPITQSPSRPFRRRMPRCCRDTWSRLLIKFDIPFRPSYATVLTDCFIQETIYSNTLSRDATRDRTFDWNS